MTLIGDWPRCMVGALTDDRCPQPATQYTKDRNSGEGYFWCEDHGFKGAATLDAVSLAALTPAAVSPLGRALK